MDMVNLPPHYNQYSIEVIEVTRHCSFNIGNSIKYMLRHLHKGASQQDLEKALWYLRDHLKHFGQDQDKIIYHPDAYRKLSVLVAEYERQPGASKWVAGTLGFIYLNLLPAAEIALERAVNEIKQNFTIS